MKSKLTLVFAGAMLAFTTSISPTLALKSSEEPFYEIAIQETEISNKITLEENSITIPKKQTLIARTRRRVWFRSRCGSWRRGRRYWWRRCTRYRCISYRTRRRMWSSRLGRYRWVWISSRPSCRFYRRFTQRAWTL